MKAKRLNYAPSMVPLDWNKWLLSLSLGDCVILNHKVEVVQFVGVRELTVRGVRFNRFNGCPINRKGKKLNKDRMLLEATEFRIQRTKTYQPPLSEEEQESASEKKAQTAQVMLQTMINSDDVLKRHNISIVEVVHEYKRIYSIKVYVLCGDYILTGTFQELIDFIKHELVNKQVKAVGFCPHCSGKSLRFSGTFCLCNDCGALSNLDNNEVVKIYAPEERQFWWAKTLAYLAETRQKANKLINKTQDTKS